jgi:hypothetical protein
MRHLSGDSLSPPFKGRGRGGVCNFNIIVNCTKLFFLIITYYGYMIIVTN